MTLALSRQVGRSASTRVRALAAMLVQGDGLYAHRFDNFIVTFIAVSLLSVGEGRRLARHMKA